MKRTLMFAFLGILGATPAFAQSGARASCEQGGARGAARVERVAGELGLDAAATAKLRETFAKYRAQLAPVRRDAWQARRALAAELAGAQPDESKVAALTNQLAGDREQMMSLARARAAELQQELTPTQYAKLMLHRHHRFGRGFHHHRAPDGGER